MQRAVIYWDVDGVFNPDGGRQPGRAWDDLKKRNFLTDGQLEDDYSRVRKQTFWISLEQGVRAGSLRDRAEFRWLTSWGPYANRQYSNRFGWGQLPVVGEWQTITDYDEPDFIQWKLAALKQEVAAEQRPFVFVDDKHITDQFTTWASTLTIPHLLVPTDPWCGLTSEEIDRISLFLDTL